jgi:predicted P-loop ATPase
MVQESPEDGNDKVVRIGKGRPNWLKSLSAKNPGFAAVVGLILKENGEPRGLVANVLMVMRGHEEWDGVLGFNEFTGTIVARKPPPFAPAVCVAQDAPWTDQDDIRTTEWMQHRGINVTPAVVFQAVEVIARENSFHPVREYLEGLVWDGVPRLDGWLTAHLGVPDTLYSKAVGLRWPISAVARIFDPGCKADCMLVLEGQQGIGKSTALKVLGGPWFTDRLSDLSSKDSAMEVQGAWIVEMAELDSISRAAVSATKAFLSRTFDRYRPPYGRRLVKHERQCVFAGTVNVEGGYLRDATGARRFWPVTCGRVDIDALKRDRDQLWAEAVVRFVGGDAWWLNTPELEVLAAAEQAQRYAGDPWEGPIGDYLAGRPSTSSGDGANRPRDDVSVTEILQFALSRERGSWTQSDQNRVVRILASLGFEQYRAPRSAGRERRYRRPDG